MELEDLLRERLVLREVQGVRAGARVRPAEQIEKRRDVHVARVVARVRLGEVEREVRAVAHDRNERRVGAVENLIERVVPELSERVENLLTIEFRVPAPRTRLPLSRLGRRLLRRGSLLFPDVVEHGNLHGLTNFPRVR